MRAIYVYYRVAPGGAEAFAGAAHAHLGAVAAQLGARFRLMRSMVEPDTWMEVLDGVADPAAAQAALDASWAAAGLGRFLAPDAKRHVEIFADACA